MNKYFLLSLLVAQVAIIQCSLEKVCNDSFNSDKCEIENSYVKSTTDAIVKNFKWSFDHITNYTKNNNNITEDSFSNRTENISTLNDRFNNIKGVIEKDYSAKLIKNYLGITNTFDISKSQKSSEICKKHSKMVMDGIMNLELWALKIFDSTGQLPSGILNGNINQFGDFDQCLKAISPNNEFSGQYCLAYLQPKLVSDSPQFDRILKLAQSHRAFQSDFDDAGHRVPRFSLINWGMCIPSSCTAKDVEYSLQEYVQNFTHNTGLKFQIRVEPEMCNVNVSKPWDIGTKLALSFFTMILIICAIATIYDSITTINESNKDEILTVFSLRKNVRWLFNTRVPKGDIEAVHGIRFFNAIMLLLAHKSMAIFFSPYVNRTALAESLGQPWTVIGRAASLYTDPFLLFSGMLTSYSLIGKLQKGDRINWRHEYIGRLLRILPPLVALIIFSTFILPLWGSGPQWNLVVGHHSKLCKKNWWKNFLFIHNYFGFGDMCLTHTHHLGIDTELFAISPIFILLVWKWPRKGTIALLVACLLGTVARFYTTMTYDLSNYVYFGTTIKRLFRTADLMYSFPPYRSTVYIMGVLLGFALRKFKEIKLSQFQLNLGYTISFLCFLLTTVGPAPMGDMNYQYNSMHAALYAAFGPIAWCLFFAWVVFVSHVGYRNKLINMLSWKGFQVTTKLSYSLYLTQFPVFFFNVGRKRHADYYYNFVSLMLDVNEYACIFIASIVLTLLFDAPFQNIKRIILRTKENRISKKVD